MNYKSDSLDKVFKKKDMILLVKNEKSKFFSENQFKNDSLVIESQKMKENVSTKFDYDFMIIKDNDEKKIFKYTTTIKDLYRTTSEFHGFLIKFFFP